MDQTTENISREELDRLKETHGGYFDPKVKAGGYGGAVTTIGMWALEEFAHLDVPGYVGAAAAFLIGGFFAWLKK